MRTLDSVGAGGGDGQWSDSRLHRFSEEKLQFRVPMGSHGRVLGAVAVPPSGVSGSGGAAETEDLYVLVSAPLSICAFSGASQWRRYTVFLLEDFLPAYDIDESTLTLINLQATNQASPRSTPPTSQLFFFCSASC